MYSRGDLTGRRGGAPDRITVVPPGYIPCPCGAPEPPQPSYPLGTYLVREDALRLGADPPLPHFVKDLEEEGVLLPEHLPGGEVKPSDRGA